MAERKSLAAEIWMDGLTNEQLGAMVREYVKESNHNSWDGWEFRRLKGALTLLQDMMLYWAASQPGYWDRQK